MTAHSNITPLPANRRRPLGITAAELQGKQFKPITWAVPDIIPAGVTILAGKPKLGKSWLVLDIAVAAARGGYTLGDRHCIEGDVLYAALEDGERRLQSRMSKMIPRGDWPSRLHFWAEMGRLEEGGLDQLREWIVSQPSPRLVIVDTFAKVRSPKAREETSYEADYRQAGMLKRLADETGVAVVAVHHVRKMEADDPLDAVSGTTGLTGAVDTILVLKREAGGVTLFGRGRDIEELELAVQFNRDNCRWSVLGDADEVHQSRERKAVIEAIRAEGKPMTPRDIADVTGSAFGATRKLLTLMCRDGHVQRPERGKYALP